MSCIIRQSRTALRPSLLTISYLHPTTTRSFSFTARKTIEAGRTQHASTALKTNVREREEQSGVSVKVVGEEVKGAEGAHYQDKVPMAVNTLSDMTRTGAWTMMNPIYTEEDLNTVQVVHRTPVTIGDKAAHGTVKFLRACFDFFTGYRDEHIPAEVLAQRPIPIKELRQKGLLLSDNNWLLRVILLESIAGVPGMVGGTLRHLRSLRLLRRDGGWIHTLLEEAENERMHLLTFMTISQPTIFTRALVLAAQGVFYNAFFLTYLVSPKTAHRFVGALEEEAVRTYTHCIADLEAGLIPEWTDVPAPKIAIDYWRLPESATLLDVIRAVRADEATHRFVNHSLADLDQKRDFNPFALMEASAEIRGTKYGFTREESAEFARQSHEKMVAEVRKLEAPAT
ncbi:alternative oxidase 1 [Naematelia encephala]|uniref:Alternative oxidase n=1 Tax=Naematelia encephala TaxID=71784 RepID=A0A1Y2BGZ9_9TREE|nr:alternative oxidase 1 [Naematelia encephala]